MQQVNSGHPGLPMGAAPLAYTIWTCHLRHNPLNPAWPDRDRFILAGGHGCALLYSLLHLTGYAVWVRYLRTCSLTGFTRSSVPALTAAIVAAETGCWYKSSLTSAVRSIGVTVQALTQKSTSLGLQPTIGLRRPALFPAVLGATAEMEPYPHTKTAG